MSGLLCITASQILGTGTFWKQTEGVIWALENGGDMEHWPTGKIGGLQCMIYFYIFKKKKKKKSDRGHGLVWIQWQQSKTSASFQVLCAASPFCVMNSVCQCKGRSEPSYWNDRCGWAEIKMLECSQRNDFGVQIILSGGCVARLPVTGAATLVMAGNPQQDREACPDLCLNRAHTQSRDGDLVPGQSATADT